MKDKTTWRDLLMMINLTPPKEWSGQKCKKEFKLRLPEYQEKIYQDHLNSICKEV